MTTEPITLIESKRLVELEKTIALGKEAWKTAGEALIEIRDSKLYRADHETFWDYCGKRWGWKPRNVQMHIKDYLDYKELSPEAQNFAHSQSQTRELAKVPAEKRETVLKQAKSHGPITAKSIKQAAKRFNQDPGMARTPRMVPGCESTGSMEGSHLCTESDESGLTGASGPNPPPRSDDDPPHIVAHTEVMPKTLDEQFKKALGGTVPPIPKEPMVLYGEGCKVCTKERLEKGSLAELESWLTYIKCDVLPPLLNRIAVLKHKK